MHGHVINIHIIIFAILYLICLGNRYVPDPTSQVFPNQENRENTEGI